jgi:hypothetical protein
VKLQRDAPKLFRAVEAGTMTIPVALKELKRRTTVVPEPETSSARSAFTVLLWDGSDSTTGRAPEKSYNAKTYPNLAFFNYYQPGDFRFLGCSKDGLTHVATFAVRVEPAIEIELLNGTRFYQADCRYLTLLTRGTVPAPATVPGLIIDDGYDGVVAMIDAMFPSALKVVSTTRSEAPQGWEHVVRDDGKSKSPTRKQNK